MRMRFLFLALGLVLFLGRADAQLQAETFSVQEVVPSNELQVFVEADASLFLTSHFLSDERSFRCEDNSKLAHLRAYCDEDYPGVWSEVRDRAQAVKDTSALQVEAQKAFEEAWGQAALVLPKLGLSSGLTGKFQKLWPKLRPAIEVFRLSPSRNENSGESFAEKTEALYYSDWTIRLSDESATALTPEFDLKFPQLLLQHEIGHVFLLMLDAARVKQVCLENELPQRVCEVAQSVAATTTEADRAQITKWIHCLDRRTVLGEWLSVRARAPIGPSAEIQLAPKYHTVIRKRGEAFADDWARTVLGMRGIRLRERDLWGVCRMEGGLGAGLLKRFEDPHPEGLYRATYLGEQGARTEGPEWVESCFLSESYKIFTVPTEKM